MLPDGLVNSALNGQTMTREALDQQLRQLQDDVLALGRLVGQSAAASIQALRLRDTLWAKKIEAGDRAVNARRFAIEGECLALIATQQPMAHDLRLLAAILEVITELERMGNYVKGIAHITTLIGPAPLPPGHPEWLERMADQADAMLRRALEAFLVGDDQAARAIPIADDDVDRMYADIHASLLDWINLHPEDLDRATRLLWVAHNLERFADRVTNICERTIFTATGEVMEFSASGGD
jgi:phosphate transport system protein